MALSHQMLLLLLLRPLVVSSVNSQRSSSSVRGPEWSRQNINKAKEGTKAVLRYALSSAASTLPFAIPFLGLIQPHGTLIAASANLAMLPVTAIDKKVNDKQLLQAITAEFQNLHSKLDQYREEQKFDTWASSAYSKPEKHINLAWQSYKTMVKSLMQSKTENEKARHRDHFLSSYEKNVAAIRELNRLLTVRGASFTYNLGDLLEKHMKCHEKDLLAYTTFLNKLIYKGIMMNQFYYKVKAIATKARTDEEAKIAYSSAQVMFQVHKQCLVKSISYVMKDVENLIHNMKPRQELAKDVRMFLENTYGRYDWMVVAFITKNSKHRILETLNKHVLAGFTEVNKGRVSVAVARQVKGTHTKVGAIREVIEECVSRDTICYQVREKLEKCRTRVLVQSGVQLPLAATYSAVHAYTRSAHDSHNAKEGAYDAWANPETFSPQTPFVYRGSCRKSAGVNRGNFVVLIKSDEELLGRDPCANRNCGGRQRGTCVPVPGVYLALCECHQPFYGRACEKNLKDYQEELERETGPIVIDSRQRFEESGF